MTLGNLFIIFLLGYLAWYWWRAKEIKDFVLRACRDHCQRLDVLLLDDAVYLRGIWFKRDPDGRVRVWRRFMFEFTSTGEDRYLGYAILLGRTIEHMELQPHRLPPGQQ
ncbi:DUF3301 domain-containing protein [Marinobacter sp. 1Y8]